MYSLQKILLIILLDNPVLQAQVVLLPAVLLPAVLLPVDRPLLADQVVQVVLQLAHPVKMLFAVTLKLVLE